MGGSARIAWRRAALVTSVALIAAAGASVAHATADAALGTTPPRTLRMVSTGYYAGGTWSATSPDGSRIIFDTSAQATPADVDSSIDVYANVAGQLRLMTPNGSPFNGAHELFAGASSNRRTVVFTAFDALTSDDTDPGPDLYAYTDQADAPVLVTPGIGWGSFRAVSDDGHRVLFESTVSYASADTDSALDLYLWDDGTLRLISGATPAGPSGAADAVIQSVADDVRRILFSNAAALTAGAPAGGATYQWTTTGGLSLRVPDPEIGIGRITPDGGAIVFWSRAGLVAGDTNGTADAYLEDGSLHLLTDGTTVDVGGTGRDVIVGYDTWVLVETAEALVPGDVDGHTDVYRWTKSTGAYELLSPGTAPIDAWLEGGTATGPIVIRTVEALGPGDTDSSNDLYLVRPGDAGPRLISSGSINDAPVFNGVSVLGDRAVFSSSAALDPSDVDANKQDVFEYRADTGSIVSIGGAGSTTDVLFRSISTDGSVIVFSTGSSLVAMDTIANSSDVYASFAAADPPDTIVFQVLPTVTPSTDAVVTFQSPGAARFECRVDGGPWSDCISPWHVTGMTEGEHTADVRAWSPAGVVDPTPGSQSWVVDLTGPLGSVAINDGAASAGRFIVRVAVPATDAHGVSVVRISSSPAITNTCGNGCAVLSDAYQVVAPQEIVFDVSRTDWGGTATDGSHTVYVQWQDGVGNWSAVASDSIAVNHSIPVATTVTVEALTNPVVVGGSSFLKATVRAADGTPVDTGSIVFSGPGVTSIHTEPVTGGVVNHWQTDWPAGTHLVTATYSGAADLAGSSGTVIQLVGTDTVAPIVKTPVTRIAASLGTGPTSPFIPVRITWSGSDPAPGFGIVRYELRQSIDGAPTTLVRLATTSVTRSLPVGHMYRFAVRAVDRAGNASEWAWGPVLRLGSVAESNTSIRYSGSWATRLLATFHGGAVRSSSSKGATATYRFVGREVAWMTTLAPSRGRAIISVDGVVVKTIDLWAATTRTRALAFDRAWTSSGTHTITVRVVGTSGRPRVDIDAFATLR